MRSKRGMREILSYLDNAAIRAALAERRRNEAIQNAVKSMVYGGPQIATTADTERGPTPLIWSGQANGGNLPGAWVEDFLQDNRLGLIMQDDFKSVGISPASGSAANFDGDTNWYAYLDTNGVITDAGIVGGGIQLAASTTAHQGVALGSLTNSYQIVDSSTNYKGYLVFEARVNLSTASLAASTDDVFVGLIDGSGTPASAVPITNTGGSLATAAGFVGFHKRGGATNGTDWNFVYNVAGGTPVYPTNLQGLYNTIFSASLATGFHKLAFVYNPNATKQLISSASTGQTAGGFATPMIRVYIDGVAAPAFLTSTNVGGTSFPVTLMAPSIAFKQQSTTASVNAQVDWIKCAQILYA